MQNRITITNHGITSVSYWYTAEDEGALYYSFYIPQRLKCGEKETALIHESGSYRSGCRPQEFVYVVRRNIGGGLPDSCGKVEPFLLETLETKRNFFRDYDFRELLVTLKKEN